MRTQLQRYAFSLAAVGVAAMCRVALIPMLGYRYSYTFFLMATFFAGRYVGLGPSILTLLLGLVPAIGLHFIPPDQRFDAGFQVATALYVILGSVVIYLGRSEQRVREALEREIAEHKKTAEDLRDSRQQLLLALEAGQLGTWLLDLRTQGVKWSALMETMHGFSPGTFAGTLTDAISRNHPEDRALILQNVGTATDPLRLIYRVVRPDGRVRWIQAVGKILGDEHTERAQMLGVCSDITEQKEAELALRQAEERFRTLATQAPVGIFQANLDGAFLFANQQWCETMGASPEQALGECWQQFLHPEDRQQFLQAWQTAIERRQPFVAESRFVHPQQGVRWVISSATPILDPGGEPAGFVGTAVDITDRKNAADSLEAEQELLRHTIEVQDHERQLIVYEIHDGLVQYATGALMQLESLRGDLPRSTFTEQVDSVTNILRRAVAEGRRLINGIRTPVLDDWGVLAAIEQLLEEEDRAHVQVEFVKDETLGRMERGIEEALYRITQEALTNIGKHSHSKHLRIELSRQADRVQLEVRDWGVGFVPANGAKRVHGLKGMSKRARMAGGRCTVESTPGQGTRILVDLPYLVRGKPERPAEQLSADEAGLPASQLNL
jgi:PAS domain S-box-containing protein